MKGQILTKIELIDLLNNDLMNEYKHMHFYLYHASAITGLHREELREFLLKEAASEMNHVTEFSDLIFGLGGTPTVLGNNFLKLENAKDIFQYALQMEEEVVINYVTRINQSSSLNDVDGKWLEIFLEKQIEHSREDVDHYRRILTGL
jgi:bacterioferritin